MTNLIRSAFLYPCKQCFQTDFANRTPVRRKSVAESFLTKKIKQFFSNKIAVRKVNLFVLPEGGKQLVFLLKTLIARHCFVYLLTHIGDGETTKWAGLTGILGLSTSLSS